jgi:hypothetical protein
VSSCILCSHHPIRTMFGTLSTQAKEPLTFVENADMATVLSRNSRDKPRISCELCRTRKVSGCDFRYAVASSYVFYAFCFLFWPNSVDSRA